MKGKSLLGPEIQRTMFYCSGTKENCLLVLEVQITILSWAWSIENTIFLFWNYREQGFLYGKYREHCSHVLEVQGAMSSTSAWSTENSVFLFWKYREPCPLVMEVQRNMCSCALSKENTVFLCFKYRIHLYFSLSE